VTLQGVARRPARWLGRDLLLRLMLPLLLLFGAITALGTYTAHRMTDGVFDRWLLDDVHALAQQVQVRGDEVVVNLPPPAAAILGFDSSDRTYFSVSRRGRLLAGASELPAAGHGATPYPPALAYDGMQGGHAVRIAELTVPAPGGDVSVRVAETLVKRHHAQRQILLMLLPAAVLLLAAAAAIAAAVRSTVRPLEAIAARWNQRSLESLEAIDSGDVPRELMPFATALNELLARIRAMLVRERQFAANAAHQLRTPLTGLQLGLARAAEAPDFASAQAVLRELDRTTQRTARLIQQLLSLGRVDPELRRDLSFVATDLCALVHDVGSACLDTALAKDIALELHTPPGAMVLTVHPELLSEALGNLLDNALRYTPTGGRVVIELVAQPPLLRIADSGPGIAADEREAVFERFTRGRHASGDGSGLGLAIVRDIAALHGARVVLDSNAWGGTTVELQL
jgi:two-component system sensor histidine kinase TctE